MGYTFSKDKNFFNFTDNETGEIVSFDVNLRQWIGKKGHPIKTNRLNIDTVNSAINIPKMLIGYDKMISISTEKYTLIDKLLSLGYGNISVDVNYTYGYQYYLDNFKDLVNYISTLQNDTFVNLCDFIIYTIKKQFPSLYEDRINPTMIGEDTFYGLFYRYPIFEEYINLLCHYCNKNYHESAFYYNKLADYFTKCKCLNIPPQKGDFCKNYSEILVIYNMKENEIKNHTIHEVQNTLALNGYTTNNFTLEIPQTIDDFIRLGKEFHNCLGTWEIDNRILPKKYAVAILRGDNWKVAIDIQLATKIIEQRYLPCNVRITDERINGYINDYQHYLYSL